MKSKDVAESTVLVGLVLMAFWLSYGCTHTVEHEISIKLDQSTECLTAFPACSPAGAPRCVDSAGVQQPQCKVACLAGRDLECGDEGPDCYQVLGDSRERVPVFCVSGR